MRKKTMIKLLDLQLFKLIFPVYSEIATRIRENEQNKTYKQNETQIIKTEYEQYVFDIIMSANNIAECLDQIYFSIELLSGFRKKKDSAYNRHDYIVFMMENFFFRITSIFDRILIFTNIVFDFGLPERECRNNTIIKNKKIKGTDLYKTLKSIDTLIKNYRNTRNKISHRKNFSEKELSDIEGVYILIDNIDKHTNNYDIDINNLKVFTNKEANKYVKEQKEKLTNITQQLEELVIEFFNVVYPYVRQFNQKKSKAKRNLPPLERGPGGV